MRNLRFASAQDSEDINQFYEKQVLPGPVDIKVSRPNDFFKLYNLQSKDNETVMLKNQDGGIDALASLIFRNAYIQGESSPITMVTDLRLSNSRNALKGWSLEFLQYLRASCQKRGSKYIFSVVSPIEDQAYNLLIRPRRVRSNTPRYVLVKNFSVVSIHGKVPLYSTLNSIRIHRPSLKDYSGLLQYLQDRSVDRLMAFEYSDLLLAERFKTWPRFSLDNFLVAKNHDSEIVGCVAPWSTESIHDYSIHQYKGFSASIKSALSWGALFGVTHRLPKEKQKMKFKFLTHLYADNPDIFESLLHHAFMECAKDEFLVYPHFEDDLNYRPPTSLLCTKVPLALYCVLPPEDPIPSFLPLSKWKAPPELELALL